MAEAQGRAERRAAAVARALRAGGPPDARAAAEYRRTFLPEGEYDGAVRSVGGGAPVPDHELVSTSFGGGGVSNPHVRPTPGGGAGTLEVKDSRTGKKYEVRRDRPTPSPPRPRGGAPPVR